MNCMITINKALLKEAKQLAPLQKLKLVEFLLEDLDQPDPSVEKAWAKESERRVTAFKAGKTKTYSMHEVFGKK